MRANRLLLSVAVITSTGLLAACGTVTNGGSQTVDVVVKGSPRAACTFSTTKFRNFGHFPNKVTLERSKEDLQADCQGEQNRHTAFIVPTRVTSKGTFGNAFNGFLPGAAYDAATGGLYEYPNPIIVDFREIGEGAKPAWPSEGEVAATDAGVDQTRIGTADIAAPMPVRMQPIMDDDLNPAMPARVTQSTTTTTTKASPEIVDAVRLATDKNAAATATTTQTTTIMPAAGKMKPIASPEDDPKVQAAKAKAKAEAAKKAKAAAAKKKAEDAAKKRAAEEAEKAAENAAAAPAPAPAASLPETTATPPAEPAPAPAAEAPATTTTTTTTTTVAPAEPTAGPTSLTDPAPAESTSTTTTTTTTAPADPNAPKDDMDKYLEGGN